SYLQILEPEVGRIHHVLGLLFTKYSPTPVCQPRYVPGEEGIRILMRPDDTFFQMPFGNVSIWPVILTTENIRLRPRIPILLAHPLKESGEKEPIPVGRQVNSECIPG